MVKAYVALCRVSAFLTSPELETEGYNVSRHAPSRGSTQPALEIIEGGFSWGVGRAPDMERKEIKRIIANLEKALQTGAISDTRYTSMVQTLKEGSAGSSTSKAGGGFKLHQISLSVRCGELLAVVGGVGSGKTSLLYALLGELELSDNQPGAQQAGKRAHVLCRRGSVAYAAQTPFIVNATLQDNILFGLPYDADKYARILDVCCLRSDLRILPQGDMSEIGEQGINLSGGQKARLSLARAVYSDSDIVLLGKLYPDPCRFPFPSRPLILFFTSRHT